MKIAFDHSIFVLQRVGGISRYFYELATRLPKLSEARCCVIAPLHVNDYLANQDADLCVVGRKAPLGLQYRRRLFDAVNNIAIPLAWAVRDVDIVHETYYSSRPTGKGRFRVVTVYDMIHELYPNQSAESQQVRAAKKSAVERADLVICISHNTRKDLLSILNVDAGKVCVTHLGYELMHDGGAQHGASRPYILYVGHRQGYKNFSGVLKAFASSRVLKEGFDLIAFGGDPFGTQMESELRRLGLQDSVRRIGGDDRLLASYYKGAAAFVYPSLYEGFGIPPLEAMSHGCPVAASNSSSIPEVIGDAAAYFDPLDDQDIKRALEGLVCDSNLSNEYRIRGQERLKMFSWNRCAVDTAGMYRRLCQG